MRFETWRRYPEGASLIQLALTPGPVLPADKSLFVIAGGAYAFGFLLATALVRTDQNPIAEVSRRRVAALVAIAAAAAWVASATLVDHHGWRLLPKAPLNLLDAGAAFGFGPMAATAAVMLARIPAQQEVPRAERRGLSLGVCIGFLWLGYWLHGG